jgi:multidrug efflux pump subunit AcrA (membrane-fusion protein)
MIWRILPPGNTSQTATKPKTPPPRPIETTSVQRGTTTQVVSLIGQVQATQQSTLRAQTSGILQEILVQPGDRVQAGRVVAILEDSDQKLAIAQAQARLSQEKSQLARLEVGTRPEIIAQRRASVTAALAREREAQDNLERIRNLVVEGALSQRTQVEAQARLDESRGERLEAEAELAEAQAGPIKEEIEAQRSRLALAQAQLEQARLAQSRTRIISSQGGVVQTRSVSQGDLIEVGTPLITLVAGDRLDVFLELPEKLTGKIFPGMPLTLTARALPQWREAANITAVVPSADPTSRRQLVRVELKNPPPGLLPGMAIAGKLRLPATETGFLVSRDALTRRDNQWLIFTIEDGQAQEIAVDLVSDGGEMVAINHPSLFPGQEIVLRGGDGLQDGAKVKIVKRLGK